MDLEKLKAQLAEADQGHLLQFWDQLNDQEKQALYLDLSSINFEEMKTSFKEAMAPKDDTTSIDEKMVPLEKELCSGVNEADPDQLQLYKNEALKAMAEGQVGIIILAGGMGTRLGVDYPKGMYDIGLPSCKTLYQIQLERVLRLEDMAFRLTSKRGCIPVYIMTSEKTKVPTQKFLERHNFFGKKKEDIVIFEQRTIPCLTNEGKIILTSKWSVARSPDGNGGLYYALKEDKVLDDMEKRGVQYLHAFCVDNVLVKVADPSFMGYAITKGAESANKVVEKEHPDEAVGVVCKIDGKIQVVEYSEIGEETSKKEDPENGKLLFRAGNICNHFFTTTFLRRVCLGSDAKLPYHVAKKAIPFVDSVTGDTAKPPKPNGIKLEKFVFDVFQFSNNFVVWECLRDAEFSPLKNGDGPGKKDTPTTAREALYKLHREFLVAAGAKLENGSEFEISPLISYEGEDLKNLVGGEVLKSPTCLEVPESRSQNGN